MKTNRTINITGIGLLIITAVNALAAGYSMIVEPTGKDLGMSVDAVLKYSPFHSFLIPGLTLFIFIGIFCCIAAYYAIKKLRYHEWIIMVEGAIITGWIFFQVIFLREFNLLHGIVGSIGILVFFWGYLLHRNKLIINQ